MYAVIKTGGKQYKVAQDDVICVEKLDVQAEGEVLFDSVLMLGDGDGATLGNPCVDGASVAAEVLEQRRGTKVIVFKKLRRKNHRRKNGHRQSETLLRITEIRAAKKKAKAKPKKQPEAETDSTETAAPEEVKGEE